MTKYVQLFLILAAFATNACAHSEGSPEPGTPDEAAAAPPLTTPEPVATQPPAEQPKAAPTATFPGEPDPMHRIFTSGSPH